MLKHPRPRAPSDVKPRHRIAMPIGVTITALGPADHRKPTQTHAVQPRAHLASSEIEVFFSPLPWIGVFGAIKLSRAHPVIERQRVTILDAHAALLGCVDHEQATKGPKGLPAKVLRPFLINDYDRFTAIPKFGSGRKSSKSRAHNNDIRFHGPAPYNRSCVLLKVMMSRARRRRNKIVRSDRSKPPIPRQNPPLKRRKYCAAIWWMPKF